MHQHKKVQRAGKGANKQPYETGMCGRGRNGSDSDFWLFFTNKKDESLQALKFVKNPQNTNFISI